MKRLFAILMTLAIVFAMNTAIAEPVGMQPFDHVVEVHYAKPFSQVYLDTLEEGDTLENDFFTRWLLENYNIKLVLDWSATSGDDYNQKIGMSIASGDLPDCFTCSYNYWKEAAENDLLMDTTDLFDAYASAKIKNAYEVGGHYARETCSIDGRMYGLSNLAVTADGYTVMFIRKDWLDTLGLEMPRTIEDVYNVAVAFRDAKLGGKQTVAIAANNSLYSTWDKSSGHTGGFDPLLSALGSYPGFFMENDGQAFYSTFTDETRTAIEMLSQWYAEGLIDPEIGAHGGTDFDEAINAGRVGMFAGPWYAIGYNHSDAFFTDENANWQTFIIENENGEWTCKHPFTFGTGFVCINADVDEETALAIMTVINVLNQYETQLNQMTAETIELLPLRNVYDTPDIVEYEYHELNKVISGETTSEDYADEQIYTFLYNDAKNAEILIHDYEPGTALERRHFTISKDDMNWQRLYSLMVTPRITATRTVSYEPESLIYVQNDTTAKYWDNLINNENTVITQIIIGQSGIEAFDALQSQWLKEGGQKILDMLNEDLGK